MNLLKSLFFIGLTFLAAPALANEPPVTLTDALGETLTLKTYPKRIVSLAPSNTEILYALGAGNRVVGVTDYCDYPPEVKQKTKIGGFSGSSLEAIVALEPDLVLAARFNPLEVIEGLRSLNIPVFALAPKTLEDALHSFKQIARLTGQTSEAARLEKMLRTRIKTVRQTVAKIPESSRPKVLWGQLKAPMYTAGPGSFINDLMQIAGGLNIAADTGADWPQIGLETLIDKNPQVIVLSSGGQEAIDNALPRLRTTDGWKEVNAVISGRIHHIDANLLQRPGPRIIDGLEALVRIFHPDTTTK